jgi:hypothetical protein
MDVNTLFQGYWKRMSAPRCIRMPASSIQIRPDGKLHLHSADTIFNHKAIFKSHENRGIDVKLNAKNSALFRKTYGFSTALEAIFLLFFLE